MRVILTEKRTARLLYQFRTAIFYQLENWESLYEIERLMGSGAKYPGIGLTCPELDVVQRFTQLAPNFSGRILCATDVDLFFGGSYYVPKFSPETNAALLVQLRKMNWTDSKLARIAQKIAHMIQLDPVSIREEFLHLAGEVTSADEITVDHIQWPTALASSSC